MSENPKKKDVKNIDKEKLKFQEEKNQINISKKLNKKNNNNTNKDKESSDKNIYNKTNKINYFNKSSKINQNKIVNNSSQKKICINISDTKKNMENKNINRINNIESIKKENIKRTELFKPKTKNKYIQNIYSNTTNTNTNNTNKKSYKSSNNNTNNTNNNNKQNENKEEKILSEFNNNTNSDINQREILYESSDIEQLNNNFFISKNHKIKNKRNKNMHTLEYLKSYNKNLSNNNDSKINGFNFQTYTLPFKKNIIKVNIVKNDEKNKNKKISKSKINRNSKSSNNLKTKFIKNHNNISINNNSKRKINEKRSLSNTNSEKNLKLITNNNIRLSTDNIAKSTKNTLNIKIYLSGCNNRKKLIKKKNQKSYNKINIKKEIITFDTNRSLDMKHKKSYSNSSRVHTQKISKENNININNKNININIDLCPETRNIKEKKILCNNNSISVPEYKLKLDAIKSRIYKLLNIYSLIALKSINNSNDIPNFNNDNKKENTKK